MTGGNPKSTGIYYDDTWNHDVFPAGTTNCSGPVPGGEASYTEVQDIDLTRLDAGQGLKGLPGSILRMTGNPLRVINPANLPVNPKTCKPIFPNQYLKVNTIFNVARSAGMRTAWSDKHPAYQALSGPSGKGPQDYFTPEINSNAIGYTTGDWTTDNAATMQYDSYKVQAVINWIRGFEHSGRHFVGTPAIFGMNFQTVSTAQKLPASDGLTGGYRPGGKVPGPLLIRALNYVNTQVGRMVTAIRQRGLASSTAIVISAKHGQSPTDPNRLARVPDSPIISAINAAWATTHPSNPNLVIFSTDDDGMLLWLSDRSQRRRELREEVPADAPGGREQHQRPADHGLVVRAQEGLRGRPVRGLLRRPRERSPAPRRYRHRPARRGLHRRDGQDRRARRRRPAGPARADPCGAAAPAAGQHRLRLGRDDPGPDPGQKICGHQGAGSQDMAADSAASAPLRRSVTRPALASEPSRVPPR